MGVGVQFAVLIEVFAIDQKMSNSGADPSETGRSQSVRFLMSDKRSASVLAS